MVHCKPLVWMDFKGPGPTWASHRRPSLHGGSSLFKCGGLGTRDADQLLGSPGAQVSAQSLAPSLGEPEEEALKYCIADGAWLPQPFGIPPESWEKRQGEDGV